MIKQAKSSYVFLSFRELPKYSYLVFAVNQDRYVLYMDAKLFSNTRNTALFQLNEDFSITPISRPIKRINIKELEENLKVERTQINKREKEEAVNLLYNTLPNLIRRANNQEVS